MPVLRVTYLLLLIWAVFATHLSEPLHAQMVADVQSLPLPAKVEDIVVGGSGRYLVLKFKSPDKLGVFDVSQLKIIGDVPAEAKSLMAAGASKLVVISPEKGVITGYDLATQKEELSQPIDQAKAIRTLIMGSASTGPAIICTAPGSYSDSKWSEVDLESLKPTPLKFQGRVRLDGISARMSAEGNAFCNWTGLSPSQLTVFVKSADTWIGKEAISDSRMVCLRRMGA